MLLPRLFQIVGLCLILLQIPRPGFAGDNPVEDARKAIVHIRLGDATGSGVSISPDGWIVTVAHMVIPRAEPTRPDPRRPFGLFPPHPRQQQQQAAKPKPAIGVAVRFGDGPELMARILTVKDSDQKTDIAILKVEGTNLPFVKLASAPPRVGEKCYAAGYPGGNWAWHDTQITRIGEQTMKTDGKPMTLDGIECNHATAGGSSGGPLFNSRYEVVGLCCRTANPPVQLTEFTRWEMITSCLIESGYRPQVYSSQSPSVADGRPILGAWKATWCGPCKQYAADLQRGIDFNGVPLQVAFNIEDHDIDQEPDQARALGVRSVPSFVLPNGTILEGYDRDQLVAALCKFQRPNVSVTPPSVQITPNNVQVNPVRIQIDSQPPMASPWVDAGRPPVVTAPVPTGIAATPPNTGIPPLGPDPGASDRPAEGIPTAPAMGPIGTPVVTPMQMPDLAYVRLVGVVQRQADLGSFSLLKGFGLSRVETVLEKQIPGKVRELLGGKVEVDLCFQRTKPDRFAAVVDAGGVPEAKIVVLVLVGQRFEGFAGRMCDFIEQKIKDMGVVGVSAAKFQFIFERNDGEVYHAVITALDESESPASTETMGAAGVAGTAVGGVTGWFRRRRRQLTGV